MDAKFEELYNKWHTDTMFLSVGNFNTDSWFELVKWSKEHTKEAIESVREIIGQEPHQIVQLLDEIVEDHPTAEGYVPLDMWCNVWIAIIDAAKEGKHEVTEVKDNYGDYRAYHKYMKDHYIPWNPFHENDPNITLEEFKQGKRNDKKLLKSRLKKVSNDKETGRK